MKPYDDLIVGAGLFGAVFAREAADRGHRVLVVEKRPHIGGNVYTERVDGIDIHRYGAHIFHTSDREVWTYVNRFAAFEPYIHTVVANYHGEIYPMPFNMYTFSRLWGISTPEEARAIIEAQRQVLGGKEPENLEEQGISLVGTDIFEKLVKGYTEKQWGRPCSELPSFIIRRLPVRFRYDNNYFQDLWQGIPEEGYTALIEHLLDGIEIRLNTDFLKDRTELSSLAETIVYTGPVDQYFDCCYGSLEYRTVRFENEWLDTPNYQGIPVMNYTDAETPFTRIIEHKHFRRASRDSGSRTIITREYAKAYEEGDEPFYPVNDDKNNALFKKYEERMKQEEHVIFGGRLGRYCYYDMDKVIRQALNTAQEVL